MSLHNAQSGWRIYVQREDLSNERLLLGGESPIHTFLVPPKFPIVSGVTWHFLNSNMLRSNALEMIDSFSSSLSF